jgi:Spy/CpxP family protein refolding chaperone
MNQPWKVILAFTGIFLAGAIAGSSTTFFCMKPGKPMPPPGQNPRLSVEQFSQRHLAMINKRLELTQEQRAQITPLINQASTELRTLNRDFFRKTDLVFERIHDDIVKVLTPEQKEKFEQFRKEQRERMRKQLQPGNGHGRRGGEDMPPPPPGGPEGPGTEPPQSGPAPAKP